MLTATVCLPLLILSLEIWLARRSSHSLSVESPTRPRLAVLIPAHNEEHSLGFTLKDVCAQLCAGDRCIVVADNCTDRTAEVAKGCGVEVVVRQDERLRGKGYALAAGVSALSPNPPDVVVFIDADCSVAPGSLEIIGRCAMASQRPIQGGNDLMPPPDAAIRDRLSAFAFRLRNFVRPSGLHRLGGVSPLFGTGMAIPWSIVKQIEFASDEAVEDMQLGIELARHGWPAQFCPSPCVSGTLPSDVQEASSQRRRWEHGHVRMLLTAAPALFLRGVRNANPAMILLALDIAVPPLALLATVSVVLALLQIVWGATTGDWRFLCVHVCCQMLAGTAVIKAWFSFARDLLTIRHLALIPGYMLWKLPIYVGLVGNAQRRWQGS